MVKFGKQLLADQVREWKEYYINYKLMKKKLKQYGQQLQQGEKDRILMDFSQMLDDEIEKIVLFLLEQQGMLASRIGKLGKQRAILAKQLDIPAIAELREAYREVGVDLIKLLKFVDLNATGTTKILKKFNKCFGYSFIDYYVASRTNHPYSQLQKVFKLLGVGAVVGALLGRLADIQECQGSYLSIYADLQERQGSYLSIYDQTCSALKDPIIEMINSSVDKLTCSTNCLRFLGQHALIADEESPSTTGEKGIEDQKYDFMSLMLNLVNTFLYMANTYIIVPTADDYSVSLGAASTVCGVVIGSMAVAQIFSSVYFSAWSNKSYFRPLVFSSIVIFLGNICYAMAYDMQSLTVLIIGRLLCGLGSARAVNRRYISDCVPARIRMQASTGFVSASALGMACGPALAGLLQWRFKIYKVTFSQSTLPGWFMAFAWLVYLVWLWISFKEPNRATEVNDAAQNTAFGQRVDIDQVANGLTQPLLKDSGSKQNIDGEVDDSEESAEDSRKAATSIGSAYRLLTPSVKVQLLIYFMLKYAMEILLSESSVLTTHYFHWNTTSVSIFLAILGLTVLPINAVVGTCISNMFEDRQLLMASQITLLVGIICSFKVTSKYSVIQYVGSALVTFVSAEVLEGVNLSLLSRVMPSRLSGGTYNGGLLSTEAGTLARVLANGTITAAGYLLGIGRLLNVTLLQSLVICAMSIVCTLWTYDLLF